MVSSNKQYFGFCEYPVMDELLKDNIDHDAKISTPSDQGIPSPCSSFLLGRLVKKIGQVFKNFITFFNKEKKLVNQVN